MCSGTKVIIVVLCRIYDQTCLLYYQSGLNSNTILLMFKRQYVVCTAIAVIYIYEQFPNLAWTIRCMKYYGIYL